MPSVIVSLHEGLSESQWADAKKHIEEQGGTITDDLGARTGRNPGFVVDYPKDSIATLENNPNVLAVESNGKVSTQ